MKAVVSAVIDPALAASSSDNDLLTRPAISNSSTVF